MHLLEVGLNREREKLSEAPTDKERFHYYVKCCIEEFTHGIPANYLLLLLIKSCNMSVTGL